MRREIRYRGRETGCNASSSASANPADSSAGTPDSRQRSSCPLISTATAPAPALTSPRAWRASATALATLPTPTFAASPVSLRPARITRISRSTPVNTSAAAAHQDSPSTASTRAAPSAQGHSTGPSLRGAASPKPLPVNGSFALELTRTTDTSRPVLIRGSFHCSVTRSRSRERRAARTLAASIPSDSGVRNSLNPSARCATPSTRSPCSSGAR